MREIYEAWSDSEGVTFSTKAGIEEQKKKGLLASNAKLLHSIEADTYEGAMMAHHEKMGWEPYKPMK